MTTQARTYKRDECVVFCKTKEAFGGLSNMAGGYPLRVNSTNILTTEALYQALRYPHLPDVQQAIINEKSPMSAKMKSKSYYSQTRSDWEQVKVPIMRWCLRLKLIQNWDKFGALLLETGDKPIVEYSHKDTFWGAVADSNNQLTGVNALGRLLMELREEFKQNPESLKTLLHVDIFDFQLLDRSIFEICKLDKGDPVYFWLEHIRSHPGETNTRKGIVTNPLCYTCETFDGTLLDYCEVEECDGEQHYIYIGCVSINRPY